MVPRVYLIGNAINAIFTGEKQTKIIGVFFGVHLHCWTKQKSKTIFFFKHREVEKGTFSVASTTTIHISHHRMTCCRFENKKHEPKTKTHRKKWPMLLKHGE